MTREKPRWQMRERRDLFALGAVAEDGALVVVVVDVVEVDWEAAHGCGAGVAVAVSVLRACACSRMLAVGVRYVRWACPVCEP